MDALGGMPGIYSARFAGEQKSDAGNNAKLLYELTDVPDEKRTAQFHCTLVFAAPKKDSLVVEAEWPGRVARIYHLAKTALGMILYLSQKVRNKQQQNYRAKKKTRSVIGLKQ